MQSLLIQNESLNTSVKPYGSCRAFPNQILLTTQPANLNRVGSSALLVLKELTG
jgi:hypothetical protein